MVTNIHAAFRWSPLSSGHKTSFHQFSAGPSKEIPKEISICPCLGQNVFARLELQTSFLSCAVGGSQLLVCAPTMGILLIEYVLKKHTLAGGLMREPYN